MASAARVDTLEQPLVDRSARSLPFGGGCAVALGAVLLAMGAMFGAGLVLLFVLNPEAREQKWLMPPAVLFLCLVGAGLVRRGLRDRSRDARAKELAARHPDEPWFADWTWNPEGTSAEPFWDGKTLFVVLFVLLVMAPFNVLWLHVLDPREEPTQRLLALMVLIPDFFMYLIARGLVSALRDHIRHGRPHLAFDAFPFALGGSLETRLTARKLAGQTGVSATLRCIDERMVRVRESDGDSVDSVRPYQLYEARYVFPGTFGGEDVPLVLPLPDGPPTALLRRPPRYWELEIAGEDRSDALRFLVPVYAAHQP